MKKHWRKPNQTKPNETSLSIHKWDCDGISSSDTAGLSSQRLPCKQRKGFISHKLHLHVLISNIYLSALPRITECLELEGTHKDPGVQLCSEWPRWWLKILWGAGTETLHCLHVVPRSPGINTSQNGALKPRTSSVWSQHLAQPFQVFISAGWQEGRMCEQQCLGLIFQKQHWTKGLMAPKDVAPGFFTAEGNRSH